MIIDKCKIDDYVKYIGTDCDFFINGEKYKIIELMDHEIVVLDEDNKPHRLETTLNQFILISREEKLKRILNG